MGETPEAERRDSDRVGSSRPSAENRPVRPVRTVRSEDLLGGARELLIEHAGAIYRLRVTRNDRLILGK